MMMKMVMMMVMMMMMEAKLLLEAAGLRVWFDEDCMHGDLHEAMAQGIEDSALFLCVTSQEYQDSQSCMRELKYADRRKKTIIHVSTGFRPTGGLDLIIGGLLYYKLPRDNEQMINKVMMELANAHQR